MRALLVAFALAGCGVERALPIPPIYVEVPEPTLIEPDSPCPSGVHCFGGCCPTGPHAIAACDDAGTCTLVCAEGFADCDGSAVNGCEAHDCFP